MLLFAWKIIILDAYYYKINGTIIFKPYEIWREKKYLRLIYRINEDQLILNLWTIILVIQIKRKVKKENGTMSEWS